MSYSKRIEQCRRGRMTLEDKAEIERLASVMSKPRAGPIAVKINRHPATVNWYMLTRGLITRQPQRARRIYRRNGRIIHPYSEQHDERVEALRTDGRSFREIAETITREFGIERSAHSVQVRMIQLAAAP